MEQWVGAMGTPQQVALRCHIVLAMGGRIRSCDCVRAEINRKTVRPSGESASPQRG